MKLPLVAAIACLLVAASVQAAESKRPSILFDASYGERLPASSNDVVLWWASSGWKVAQTRPVPKKTGKAIEVSLAQNETECAQLVVNPAADLRGLVIEATGLQNAAGAQLPADAVEILRVRYVNVERPTDRLGAVAPWPDPLPPIQGPLDLDAGKNQPFWVRVHAPKGAPAGDYAGTIRLRADGYSADVALRVRVYGFELPDRMTCETAFGFDTGAVDRYHRLETPKQRYEVLAKYWASLSAHHISPYWCTPDVGFPVEWVKLKPEQCAGLPQEDAALLQQHALTPVFDWAAWDAEILRMFATYHFQTFRLGLPGIGGEDMQGFKNGTREWDLAFGNYCRTAQEHLREIGLLDAAYIYWIDEPTRKDYPHVMAGFARLKKAAPDLRRMLTEQIEPELIGGPNLWCPMTMTYKHEKAEAVRKNGDQFWWYVCTIPKAPYPGLFTDHPGTDLRVWLWQTWQYDIRGILIWQSNLWTTGCAYPDPEKPQNPYEDAMSWIHGYGVESGEKRPWGNGDGRFMYPPEAAAGANSPVPVLDGPVDSIRWEMLRDGIEDYEYLAILKRILDERRADLPKGKLKKYEALLTVPEAISSDLKTYTWNPAPIEKRRHQIGRAIETLSGIAP